MAEPVRTHGVLITFRRRDALVDHLRILSSQTHPLTSLLVVDNDNDPEIRALVESNTDATPDIRYLGLDDNPGPAGGIAAGIADVLMRCADDEWLVLLDDDDPPAKPTTLAALAAATADLGTNNQDFGGVGLWGSSLGRSGRLRAATASEPQQVAYLPGGACPHYSVGALRRAGGPDPSLFFGFDDLDLGLTLGRSGARLWSAGIARDHGWTSMVEERSASRAVEPATWRRYYSLRNLVLILRRNGRTGAALTMSLVAGIGKPLANLPCRPGLSGRNLRLNLLALRHGWTSRAGKHLDPLDLPGWLR